MYSEGRKRPESIVYICINIVLSRILVCLCCKYNFHDYCSATVLNILKFTLSKYYLSWYTGYTFIESEPVPC